MKKPLHYSYMELELITPLFTFPITEKITLFLYGIGALYIDFLGIKNISYYIIPIWNWSPVLFRDLRDVIVYYIIPIWNWSLFIDIPSMIILLITLFLYGIGAEWEQRTT